jgi:hypothetical protein
MLWFGRELGIIAFALTLVIRVFLFLNNPFLLAVIDPHCISVPKLLGPFALLRLLSLAMDLVKVRYLFFFLRFRHEFPLSFNCDWGESDRDVHHVLVPYLHGSPNRQF